MIHGTRHFTKIDVKLENTSKRPISDSG